MCDHDGSSEIIHTERQFRMRRAKNGAVLGLHKKEVFFYLEFKNLKNAY